MALYHSMHELIGNTPLVELTNFKLPQNVHLFAKLELFNPAGSVKDRTGAYMIADAEKKGLLKAGGTIVEATAGNTGLGVGRLHLTAVQPGGFLFTVGEYLVDDGR